MNKSLLCSALLLGASFNCSAALDVHFPFSDSSFKDGEIDTLQELDQWLRSRYSDEQGDVNVYIAAGEYQDTTNWFFDANANKLTFQAEDPQNPPVFDACLNGTCLEGAYSGYFLHIKPTGKPMLSNMEFRDFIVRNFVNGILIRQASDTEITHVTIEQTGSAFNQNIPLKTDGNRQHDGYAAINVRDSHDVKFSNIVVSNAYNDTRPLLMHALYVVASSDISLFESNISMVSGDPVRMRDGAAGIHISGNLINNSGQTMVSTFEDIDSNECPSGDISSAYNEYGMMFPYSAIYQQSGFDEGWSRKPYLREGMAQSRAFKLTIDPAFAPEECEYTGIESKWDVFNSKEDTLFASLSDSRIISASTNVQVAQADYVRVAADGIVNVETNQLFIGCNSSDEDTCDDNDTSSVDDDTDPMNADDPNTQYTMLLNLETGTVDKLLSINGGGLVNYQMLVPASPTPEWVELAVSVPVNFSTSSNSMITLSPQSEPINMKRLSLLESK